MICPGDIKLSAGWILRSAITAVTIQAVVSMGRDDSLMAAALSALRTSQRGRSLLQKPSSKQAKAGTMVSQFKNERFPLSIILNWNNTITDAAICRATRGQNTNKGAA